MIKFIISFIVSLISILGIAYCYYKISDVHVKLNWKIIFVFLWSVFFLTFVKYFDLTYLSAISYFLTFPFLFYLLSFTSFDRLLFDLIILWIYGIVLDIASMAFVILLHAFIEFNIYGYTSRIIMSSFIFLMYLVVAKSRKIKNLLNNLFKKIKRINYFSFIFVVFVIFALLMGVVIFLNLNDLKVSSLLVIIFILFVFSFMLMLSVRIHLAENNIFLKLLKENNEFYLKIEDENRIFRHNLIAKLLSIKSVSTKKARNLIDDFISSFNSNIDFSVKIKDMPYGLNGIIYEKIYPYLDKIYIKIDNRIDFDIFKKLKPRRYNVLVEKMIIALDNAIESCITSNEKILVINLYFEEYNIILDIKNTFSSSLNLEELGNLNYSTKSYENRRRGLGLFSALRNSEVKMSIKIINNLFVTRIIAKQNMNE